MSERAYIAADVASLGDRHATEPVTAAECQAEAMKCARRVDVLMAAKEYDLAKDMLAQAREWTLKAVRIEQGEAA